MTTTLIQSTSYLTESAHQNIARAYDFAAKAHKGQKRRTGEDYITHPYAVAIALAELGLDEATIIAGLLHDVVEDTRIDNDTLREAFGAEVAYLVAGVSKLDNIPFISTHHSQAENFRKMLLSIASDLRVLLIKLADRLDNLKTIGIFSAAKQQRIAQESLDIYTPMASQLGIYTWQYQMEERCFAALFPSRAATFRKALSTMRGETKTLVAETQRLVESSLLKNGINAEVTGREKSLYSIYQKMRKKGCKFEDIHDLFAFRIIVGNADNAYRTLGIINNLFQYMPGTFKDYISLPKSNGYQGLHTVLVKPNGLRAEFQIRSQSMHRHSEYGLAAHWRYKQHPQSTWRIHPNWVDDIVSEYDNYPQDPEGFWREAKRTLLPNEVFVITPKGKLIDLPAGATALDFAYRIHSNIGDKASFCMMNNEKVPLNTVLMSGAVVSITTDEAAAPTPQWLDFAITAKAQSHIRAHLRRQSADELLALGKNLFGKALKRYGLSLTSPAIQARLEGEDADALFLNIAQGKQSASFMAYQVSGADEVPDGHLDGMVITDADTRALQFSRCCLPIKGDAIMGQFTNKGIVVHRKRCPNVKRLRQEKKRYLEMLWGDDVKAFLPSRIVVTCENKIGILANITDLVAKFQHDIDDITMDKDINYIHFTMLIKTHGRDHLATTLNALRKLPTVMRATRVEH